MPARRQTYREIADDMQERISLGEYAPGDQLPSYRDLAHIYSVSTATAYRAVSLLQDRGLVVGQQGVALYVVDSDT